MSRFLSAAVLILVCLVFSGCGAVMVGVAGGAAAVTWVNGKAESVYVGDMTKSWDACENAFKALDIASIETKSSDPLKRSMTGRTKSDDKVKISLKSLTDTTTKISIRINTFGDKDLSARIHNEIDRQLKLLN